MVADDQIQGLLPVRHGAGGQALLFQVVLDEIRDVRFVLDDQDRVHRVPHAIAPRALRAPVAGKYYDAIIRTSTRSPQANFLGALFVRVGMRIPRGDYKMMTADV